MKLKKKLKQLFFLLGTYYLLDVRLILKFKIAIKLISS